MSSTIINGLTFTLVVFLCGIQLHPLIHANDSALEVQKISVAKPLLKIVRENLDDKWKWDHSSIGIEDKNYPLVLLRNGYRRVKIEGDKVTVGWKADLINVSAKNTYLVNFRYMLVDKDSLVVSENESKVALGPGALKMASGYFEVSKLDLERVKASSFTIGHSPKYKSMKENLSSHRFTRAGQLLKVSSPAWVLDWLQDRLSTRWDETPGTKELLDKYDEKALVIAKELGMGPDKTLQEIFKKLRVKYYDIPSWRSLTSSTEFDELTYEEKIKLRSFLIAKINYDSYDPDLGTQSPLSFETLLPIFKSSMSSEIR